MSTAAQDRVLMLAKIYDSRYPDSDTLVKAAQLVRDANLPPGENAGLQVLYQFDGKETVQDHVSWDAPRKPYGDDGNLGWDHKMDCSEFTRRSILFATGCRVDIGNCTRAQLSWLQKNATQVPFEKRRPFDVILYDFKHEAAGVSHAALVTECNDIMQTTSPGNPLRIDNASYGAADRVGVWRVLTNEEYNALMIQTYAPVPADNRYALTRQLQLTKPLTRGIDVKVVQSRLKDTLDPQTHKPYYPGALDGVFGPVTDHAVHAFQSNQKLKTDGVVGKLTATALGLAWQG